MYEVLRLAGNIWKIEFEKPHEFMYFIRNCPYFIQYFFECLNRAHLKIDGQGPCISSVYSSPLRPIRRRLLTIPFQFRDECKKMQPSVKSNKTSTRNGHEWEERAMARARWGTTTTVPWREPTTLMAQTRRRLLTMFKCQLGLLTGHFVDGTLYPAMAICVCVDLDPSKTYIPHIYIPVYVPAHQCKCRLQGGFVVKLLQLFLLLVVCVIG